MADAPTADQVVEAANGLGSQFTRDDLASALGVQVSDLKSGVKEARQSGRLEKSGENSDGKGLFKVA